MTTPHNDPLRAGGEVPMRGQAGYDPASGASRAVPPSAHDRDFAATDRGLNEEEASYLRYREEDRSLGEIASDLLDNATTLIRQEVELAKVEAKESATKAGKGVGMLAGAGVAGLLALIALTLTAWWGMAVLIGSSDDPALGWGGLIVTIIWLVIAGILAAVGKGELNKVRGLKQTQETVKKIPNAATGHEEKNR
ncbi:phage holin family protein [Tessaracoccus flavus]|uniref:phage holin family protein n=1 Tax=Tessaracoccus flavus TaxID=1610493 RepID=UPI001C40B09B|nr:phage holin family protein [Tessaracoccus flavus]